MASWRLASFAFATLCGSGAFSQQIVELHPPDPQPQQAYSSGVTGVPDLDNDGVGDVALGSYNYESNGKAEAGRIYVYSGATGQFLRQMASPHEIAGSRIADALRGVPDVDGDGAGDILAGARGDNPAGRPAKSGAAYVFSGATGAVIHELLSPNPEAGGIFGDSVGTVPDIDNDGIDDLLVNGDHEDPGASPTDAGRGYVFSGATGALLWTLRSPNEETSGFFACNIDGIPDVDGDDKGDILCGALGETVAGKKSAGRSYIFSGGTGLLLQTLVTPNPDTDGEFGWVTWGTTDVNGDSFGDVIVGAYKENPGASPTDSGRAYVFSGNTGALLYTLQSSHPVTDGWFGFAVSAVSDFDGDAVSDFVVGARLETAIDREYAGRVYVFSGATGAELMTYISPRRQISGQFGIAIDGIPNGPSGMGDLVIGSVEDDPLQGTGRGYIYSFPMAAEGWAAYE